MLAPAAPVGQQLVAPRLDPFGLDPRRFLDYPAQLLHAQLQLLLLLDELALAVIQCRARLLGTSS